jgi:hypothetical protein
MMEDESVQQANQSQEPGPGCTLINGGWRMNYQATTVSQLQVGTDRRIEWIELVCRQTAASASVKILIIE